jgi:protein prenyltransferase alpha subunit repeat containing protein 1
MASSSYPRNYYAWTYRYWVLSYYCSNDLPLIEKEYKDTCHWIETNISDYSGFQYLQHLMKMSKIDNDELKRDVHMNWVNQLIIRYPGHESLWCHRRFCSDLFIKSIDYCKLQHEFIRDIVNDQFKDLSFNDNIKDMIMQKEYALKFGLWQSLLVSDMIVLLLYCITHNCLMAVGKTMSSFFY